MNDLYGLLPHSRKDAKLDTKTKLYQLNELAELYNCNNVLFFEARKGKDLYLWMSKAPNGPTVKMHLQNSKSPRGRTFHIFAAPADWKSHAVHTMEELNFTGNCLKGSRPILSFDSTFDTAPQLGLIKELLMHIFGVPKGARKTKPFIDHVMGFTIADGKIWIRCYQISETEASKAGHNEKEDGGPIDTATAKATMNGGTDTHMSLIEIGPRFVMTPIVILEGSFGGPVIYENKEFISPNQIRSDNRREKAGKYNRRTDGAVERTAKKGELGLRSYGGRPKKVNELDNGVLFA